MRLDQMLSPWQQRTTLSRSLQLQPLSSLAQQLLPPCSRNRDLNNARVLSTLGNKSSGEALSSGEDPRTTYKKNVLNQLRTSGYDTSVIDVVEKALDNATLDRLFATASTALTVSSPPMAVRMYEWYYGEAATTFAGRENKGGRVLVQGPVHGIVMGGGISGGEVKVAGAQWNVSSVSIARDLLRDMRVLGIDASEGEKLLERVEAAPETEKSSLLSNFVAWAKTHAGDLTSSGLALLSILVSLAH